jgi:hypothetical protein
MTGPTSQSFCQCAGSGTQLCHCLSATGVTGVTSIKQSSCRFVFAAVAKPAGDFRFTVQENLLDL